MICRHCLQNIQNIQITCPLCGGYLFVIDEERANAVKAIRAIEAYEALGNSKAIEATDANKATEENDTVIAVGDFESPTINASSMDRDIADEDTTENADLSLHATRTPTEIKIIEAEKSINNVLIENNKAELSPVSPIDILTIKEAVAKKPEVRKSRRLIAGMPETKTGGYSASLGPSNVRKQDKSQSPDAPSRSHTDDDSIASKKRGMENRKTTSGGRRSRSQPPAKTTKTPILHNEQPRMIKRHEYVAIAPTSHGSKAFNWMRLCIIALVCITLLTIGTYLFLSKHSLGQLWLASLGREATMQAYHELGRQNMANGSISRAIRALEIAQSKDPDNFEVLIDLGTAYKGNNQLDLAELCYTRAIQFSPKHPEAYRFIIQIMLEQDRNYEALQLAKIAIEQTGAEYFDTLYKQLVPKMPTALPIVDTFAVEIDVTLKAEKGAIIYYTINGDDPRENGILYQETIVDDKAIGFHLEEGAWRVRAVSYKDGMYSEDMVKRYIINKPIPDMPKSNVKPGRYDTVKNVTLRAAKDCIIYYTVDGTTPTENSKVFNSDEPIKLRIGKTTIRAIAVNNDKKVSMMMEVTYECGGKTKTVMSEKDTVDGLVLYGTTKEQFIAKYGNPTTEKPDGEDAIGTYEKLLYPFGYAVFVTRKDNSPAVLAELSTHSDTFEGPRNTKVGMRMENIIDAFRDDGGEDNSRGGRDLYRRTDGKIAFLIKLGQPTDDADESDLILDDSMSNEYYNTTDMDTSKYKISYFLEVKKGHFIELTYVVTDGIVESIEWLRYDTI